MLRVRHDASSAATVRHALTVDLAASALTDESVDDVVLVASELVGNAVTHVRGRTDVDVEWRLDDGFVLLLVADDGAHQPQLRHVDATATGGRGLAIVAALAAEWGVRDHDRGKQVWARVPVHRTR